MFPWTPRNTGVYTRTSSNVCHSHEWRVDTASGKTLKNGMRVYTLSDRRSKKNACIYGLRSEGVNQDHFHFSLTPLSDSRTNCSSFLSKILGILKSDEFYYNFFLSRTYTYMYVHVHKAKAKTLTRWPRAQSTSAFPNAHYRGSLIGQLL